MPTAAGLPTTTTRNPLRSTKVLFAALVLVLIVVKVFNVARQQHDIVSAVQHPIPMADHNITTHPLLVLVSKRLEPYHRFFAALLSKMGIPHTEDENADWTMCWGSKNFPVRRNTWQRLNRIFGTQAMCSKRGLCEAIWNTTAVLRPDDPIRSAILSGVMPSCFLLPQHWEALKEFDRSRTPTSTPKSISSSSEEASPKRTSSSSSLLSVTNFQNQTLDSSPQWVMKLDGTSGGAGVHLASKLSDVVDALESCSYGTTPPTSIKVNETQSSNDNTNAKVSVNDDTLCKGISKGIVQQFVQQPLLIRGCRITVRVFTLVDSLSPMRAFISYTGYVLIASEPEIDESRPEGVTGLCPWITNWSYQKENCPRFVDSMPMTVGQYFRGHYTASRMLDNSASSWTTFDLFQYLRIHRPDLSLVKVWSNIRHTVGSALLRSYPAESWRTRYRPRTDQLMLGIDTTILDNGEIRILEINCHPSWDADLFQTHRMSETLIAGMVRLTGGMVYRYPKPDSQSALQVVHEFCERFGACTNSSIITLRDTELMLRDRHAYDIALPSYETEYLYEKLLDVEKFRPDHLHLAFVKERIAALNIRDGDTRLLHPTESSLKLLDNLYFYDPDNLE